MTLQELTNQIVGNTRRSDKAADGSITTYINLALKEIGQVEPFKLLRSEIDLPLDAGLNYVLLPATTVQVVEVRILPDDLSAENSVSTLSPAFIGYEVHIMDQRTIQKRFPNLQLNSRGIPEYCFVNASRITFVPPCNLPYTVRVLMDGYIPEMNDPEDENPLPSCDNAVIAWATARTFKSIQLWDDASGWESEYKKALRLAIEENNRRSGQLRQMRGAQSTRSRYIDPRINQYTRQTYGDILE